VLLSEGIARWQGPMNILMRRPAEDARFFSRASLGLCCPICAAPIKRCEGPAALVEEPCVVTLMAMVLSDHRLAT